MTYEELLKNYALAHEEVVVMTAENRALVRGLPPVLGSRFIDTGITEQTMVGAAAGLALRGRKPIIHALASFLTMRAFEFVRTDIGISGLPVKMSSFVPGFLSDGNGPTHQAIEDVALMRGIPGMQVFCPADNEDLLTMLPSIWDSPNPAYVRINTRPAAVTHTSAFTIGKAEVIAEGKEVTLLVYGMMLEQAVETRTLLEQHGLTVGLVNMRSLAPVDKALLLALAQKNQLLVSIEDHFLTGGLFSIMAEVFLEAGVTAKVLPIALKHKWFKPALLSHVLEYEGFTGDLMATQILNHLGIRSTISEKSTVAPQSFDE
jgi:transketolase